MSFNDRNDVKVVIPARYGSTRLPGKPLVDLAGTPMVVRVFDIVKKAFFGAEIVVATDNIEIRSVLAERGIPSVITCASHESGTDRIAEVAAKLGWQESDIVFNIQGDEPLIPVDLLVDFYSFCKRQEKFSMATISAPIESEFDLSNPAVVKVVVNKFNDALYFSRSAIPFCRDKKQFDWPLESYKRHIGIYAYTVGALRRITSWPECELEGMEKLEQLRALWNGLSIRVMENSVSPPHGVDTQEDVIRVNEILKGA